MRLSQKQRGAPPSLPIVEMIQLVVLSCLCCLLGHHCHPLLLLLLLLLLGFTTCLRENKKQEDHADAADASDDDDDDFLVQIARDQLLQHIGNNDVKRQLVFNQAHADFEQQRTELDRISDDFVATVLSSLTSGISSFQHQQSDDDDDDDEDDALFRLLQLMEHAIEKHQTSQLASIQNRIVFERQYAQSQIEFFDELAATDLRQNAGSSSFQQQLNGDDVALRRFLELMLHVIVKHQESQLDYNQGRIDFDKQYNEAHIKFFASAGNILSRSGPFFHKQSNTVAFYHLQVMQLLKDNYYASLPAYSDGRAVFDQQCTKSDRKFWEWTTKAASSYSSSRQQPNNAVTLRLVSLMQHIDDNDLALQCAFSDGRTAFEQQYTESKRKFFELVTKIFSSPTSGSS